MAITGSSNPIDQLNSKFSRSAGGSSIAGGLVVFVLAIWLMVALIASSDNPLPSFMPVFSRGALWLAALLLAGLGGLAISAGVKLARKIVWAFQVLLAIWLAMTVAAVCVHAAVVLHVIHNMDSDKTLTGARIAAYMLLCLVFSGSSLGLLVVTVKASESVSRMRYFGYVMTSIAAAAAVLIVINIVSQGDFYRVNLQSSGASKLSERTMRVLSALDKPVHITSVYILKDDKKKTIQYSQPVLDLLAEMRQCNPKVDTADASSEEDKARLVARLQQVRAGKAQAYIDFLKKFVDQSHEIVKLIDAEKEAWGNLGDSSYISIWPFSVQINDNFKSFSAKTRELSEQVSKKLQGKELIDYSGLSGEVGTVVAVMDELMRQISLLIRQMGPLHEQVIANGPKALEAFDKALATYAELVAVIGPEDSPVPEDPSTLLEKFVQASIKTATYFRAAGDSLNDMGGKEAADLLNMAGVFRPSLGENTPSPLSYAQLLSSVSEKINQVFVVNINNLIKNANTETLKKYIGTKLRPDVRKFQDELKKIRAQLPAAIEKLSGKIDEKSLKLIEQAAKNELFQAGRQILSELEKLQKALPDLPPDTLADDLKQENIVIIETDDNVKVLPFDKIWPLKVSPWVVKLTEIQDADARMFDGDSAICSAVLAMTHKPFANVVIAYYEPQPMYGQSPGLMPLLPMQSMGYVRQRLEEANFAVKEWNLTMDFPKLDDEKTPEDGKSPTSSPATRPNSIPKILLVLPPPLSGDMMGNQQIQPFGVEHLNKIVKQINSGTPAVVLAGWHMLMPTGYGPPTKDNLKSPPYVLGPYLRQEWGLDVLTNYRLFWGLRDKIDADRKSDKDVFRVSDWMRNYLPLSTFEDHPIGKPLEALKLMWFNACPIVLVKNPPPGVKTRTLLAAPADATNYWATTDILQFAADIDMRRDSSVSPDFNKAQDPDLKTPLTIAAVATRDDNAQRNIKGSRLVVLAMSQSFNDWYLTRPISSDEERTMEPPKTDADLLINSLYWGIGRESSIAAGPLQIRPIGKISPSSHNIIWAICIIVLPLLVIASGVVVMVLRKQ